MLAAAETQQPSPYAVSPEGFVRGYNHNFRYRGHVYHVQTEDYGAAKRYISTHCFSNGAVISSQKTPYPVGLAANYKVEAVVELMKNSHREMIHSLRDGALDSKIEQTLNRNVQKPPVKVDPSAVVFHQSSQTDAVDPTEISANESGSSDLDVDAIRAELTELGCELGGTLFVALIDADSSMSLATVGACLPPESAIDAIVTLYFAEQKIANRLDAGNNAGETMFSLRDQYHFLRPIRGSYFLYVAMDRDACNLAMARHKINASVQLLRL